jgi:threonine synthase
VSPRAWFRCIKGCHGELPLTEVVYECPTCGALLEVAHDLKQLRKRSPAGWTRLFDERYKRTTWPYGSGVWGKKEWVAPHVADDNVVSLDEGGTNLFWAERYGAQLGLSELWVKMCGLTHTGSFKDLGMTVLVSTVKQMIAQGVPIHAVACASTGDTSAALAAYCAVAGIPAVVILPRDKVSIPQLVQPLSNGALVLSLDTDFDGCMEMVKRLAKEPGIYLANSMNSLRVEGQKTVGIETVQQFDWTVPDWVIIPGGNLGNTAALGAGFLMMHDLGVIQSLPRIVVAQAEHANPLYLASQAGFRYFEPIQARPTLASAIQIGNPVSYEKAVATLKRFDGLVEQASEDELAQAAARADLTGMFTDPHTGVALAVLEKLVARKEIGPADRVVVVSTATGLKFPDFKIRYHEGALEGIADRYANRPVLLPADYEAVKRAALSGVERAAGARVPAGPATTRAGTGTETVTEAATTSPAVAGRGES